MRTYLMKNKVPAQITVAIVPGKAPPEKILVLPPRAVREAELSDDEYKFVLENYQREVVISPKAV